MRKMNNALTQRKENIKTDEMKAFSVAMSVYAKDNAEWFDMAMNSILCQTAIPDEIVLVVDGPVPDAIHAVIHKYQNQCETDGKIAFIVTYFERNQGLGLALNYAITHCKNELIARMDSDDIAVRNRFEQQLKYFDKDDTCDIVGGDIEEFIGTPSNVVGKRIVPSEDKDIRQYMKKRCPFNHMTVMYKKSAVLAAGNYLDWFWNEDYYLWLRMYLQGASFANTGTTLVNVRVGEDMYKRRGGWNYFLSEVKLQKYMYDKRIIGLGCFINNSFKRLIVQVLLPGRLRGQVYRLFARK